jgi:predicted flap endonuclease-1-like 5' DNA nuclease
VLVVLLGSVHVVRWLQPSGPADSSEAHVTIATSLSAPASPARGASSTPAAPPWRDDPLLFLSTAPPDSLQLLPGIGPVLAARIAADRDARGPFTTWTELDRVRGIGPATIRRLQDAAARR